ncbi:hypothetical protein ACJVDH_13800 [Pedobacter sp. AW1-32]|uniref:hypothetical protein n=1 Tax=Pedobacter sp. AW1-32 TaxID=3383026 RepID=UPI003FF0ED3E
MKYLKNHQQYTFNHLIFLPIYLVLILVSLVNGFNLISSDSVTQLAYINIYGFKPAIPIVSSLFKILLYSVGGFQLLAVLILFYSLITGEFKLNKPKTFLKWGLLTVIISVLIHGYIVRVISNHPASAGLYFHLVILYIVLAYTEFIENKASKDTFYDKIKLLPIYIGVFYTMGFPGWQKIVNGDVVVGKYIIMFKDSFLAQLPGGIKPFIYFLGILELTATIMLLISFVRGEFLLKRPAIWLKGALFLSVLTFIFLCFGLSVLIVYQGATNLLFYSLFTLVLYIYVDRNSLKSKL